MISSVDQEKAEADTKLKQDCFLAILHNIYLETMASQVHCKVFKACMQLLPEILKKSLKTL